MTTDIRDLSAHVLRTCPVPTGPRRDPSAGRPSGDALRDAAVGRSGDAAVRAVATAWRTSARSTPNLYMVTDLVGVAGDEANEAAAAALVTVLTRVTESYGLEAPESERAAGAAADG